MKNRAMNIQAQYLVKHGGSMNNRKPIGGKNYGSIPHLPNSRMGEGDHSCHEGQEAICNIKTRDKHDLIIVQEKLDGSNVGIAKVNGEIIALTRAGYVADTSPYEQHHKFNDWVKTNSIRFDAILNEGERLVGEWLIQAHGTKYILPHEPFVAFDIMTAMDRMVYNEFIDRVDGYFIVPKLLHIGGSLSIEDAMLLLGEFGFHGAVDKVEGAIWRVERNEINKQTKERKWRVDFLAKYVRPDKKDGIYLESVTGLPTVWN